MEDHAELRLTLLSPERTLFDGAVEIVTLPGASGSFSVLRGHAPLLSSLTEGTIRYRERGEERALPVRGGFVEVCGNVVSVCVEV